MRMLGSALLVLVATAVPVVAVPDHPAECRIAENQLDHGAELPNVIKAIKAKQFNILVIGAGSSTLPGADGATKAYPARLQAVLAERLPGVTVNVSTDVKSGRTAPEALATLKSALASKPALVVWQAGTVDAMKSLELDSFNAALDKGVATVQRAGADVILINGQYSPRTESLIALSTYAENMRWVALRRGIPLLDRFNIMKVWAELGTFDFETPTKKLDIAERVHDCIGRLLGDLVVEGSKTVAPPGGGR
ncbi:MAG: SGNH/GDSL hydrolase family protein [Pseudolabrys sp.]|nr:SGNH/GDSL hydrolase family protein [Pseudolabrys sp.]